jgi:hypothetical protein
MELLVGFREKSKKENAPELRLLRAFSLKELTISGTHIKRAIRLSFFAWNRRPA